MASPMSTVWNSMLDSSGEIGRGGERVGRQSRVGGRERERTHLASDLECGQTT